MDFLSIKCKTCGAPMEVSPDSMLNICKYCGTVYPAKAIENIPIYIASSISKNEIINSFNRRMSSDRDMKGKDYNIVEVKGTYVPLYISHVSATGRWEGYKWEGSGKNRRKVRKSGKIDIDGHFPTVARKYAYEFGLPYIGNHIYDSEIKKFDEVDWNSVSLPVMSIDIDEEDAEDIIKDDFVDEIGEKIKSKYSLDAFTHFECHVDIHDRFILLYPLWTVVYKFKGGTYRVALEGSKGRVILAMEPMFTKHRIVRFLGALGLGILSGIVWHLGWSLASDSDSGGGKILLGTVVLLVIILGTAFKLSRSMLKSVRIERG